MDVDRDRVNLLTLHSTKGLEFSRVYIVGAEDAQLPGRPPSGVESSPAEIEEARRLLYVGMTRAKDRLVLSRAAVRGGNPTGGTGSWTRWGWYRWRRAAVEGELPARCRRTQFQYSLIVSSPSAPPPRLSRVRTDYVLLKWN